MKTLSPDTPPEVEEIVNERYRQMTPQEKITQARPRTKASGTVRQARTPPSNWAPQAIHESWPGGWLKP
jgi:hypothetical protein